MIRRGGEAGLLAGFVTAKNWTSLDVYRHYNMGVEGWPDNLPPPPNPGRIKTFMYAALQVESEELSARSKFQQARSEQNRKPRSRFQR